MEHTPGRRNPILALRIPEADLQTIEAARTIMGDGTMSAYARQCLLLVSRAIIAASLQLDLGPGEGEWSRCGIAGARFVREEQL
jgi:hypothetical protein